MNLTLIRWLLRHRDLLTAVIAAAQKYDRDLPYLDQWKVVDEIARLIIPALEQEDVAASALCDDWDTDENVAAFSLGAEVSAMGIDWESLIDVVIPILLAILKALADTDD